MTNHTLNPTNTYHILEKDTFDPRQYPLVVKELANLSLETMHLPLPYKSEIIISFLKGHTMKTHWVQLNPALAEFMGSLDFSITQSEYLFVSCRDNKSFLKDFEGYIEHTVLKL
jgi:hypothetical protein